MPAGAEMKNDRGIEMGYGSRRYNKRRRYNDFNRYYSNDLSRSWSYTAGTIRWMARMFFTRIVIFTIVSGFSLAVIKCYFYFESVYVAF